MSLRTEYRRPEASATARILPVARVPECFGSGTYRYWRMECKRCASRPLVGSTTHSLRSACVSAAAGDREVTRPRPVTAAAVVKTEPLVFEETISPETMARLVLHLLAGAADAYAPEIIASLKKTIRKLHVSLDEPPPTFPKSKPVRAVLERLQASGSSVLDPKSILMHSRGFPGDDGAQAQEEDSTALSSDPRVQIWEEVDAPLLSRHIEETRRRGRIGSVSPEAGAVVLGVVGSADDPVRLLDSLKPVLFVPQARNAWGASAYEIARHPAHEASRRLIASLEAAGAAGVAWGDHFSPAKVIAAILAIPAHAAEGFVARQTEWLDRATLATVFTAEGVKRLRRKYRGLFDPHTLDHGDDVARLRVL